MSGGHGARCSDSVATGADARACEEGDPKQLNWLAQAVVLSEAAGEIQKDKATTRTPRDCILEKDGTRVRQDWGKPPYHIALHAACLDIAETVMRTSRRHSCYVRSIGALWDVLSARWPALRRRLFVDGFSTYPWDFKIKLSCSWAPTATCARIAHDCCR